MDTGKTKATEDSLLQCNAIPASEATLREFGVGPGLQPTRDGNLIENPGLEWRIASPDSSYASLDRWVDGDVAAASVLAGWLVDPSFPPRMCSSPSRNSRKLTCVLDPVIKHLTSRWPRSFSSSVWHSLTSASRSSTPLPGLLCAWNM
uniref:Uncharacterized protein n=1 Tax=Anopheles melas TaxID=34690 RepID=A0A182TZ83_9DIPT